MRCVIQARGSICGAGKRGTRSWWGRSGTTRPFAGCASMATMASCRGIRATSKASRRSTSNMAFTSRRTARTDRSGGRYSSRPKNSRFSVSLRRIIATRSFRPAPTPHSRRSKGGSYEMGIEVSQSPMTTPQRNSFKRVRPSLGGRRRPSSLPTSVLTPNISGPPFPLEALAELTVVAGAPAGRMAAAAVAVAVRPAVEEAALPVVVAEGEVRVVVAVAERRVAAVAVELHAVAAVVAAVVVAVAEHPVEAVEAAVVAVAAGVVDTAAVVAAVAAAVEGAAERPDISRVGLSRTGIPLARRILAAACPGFSASRKCGRGEDRQECLSYSADCVPVSAGVKCTPCDQQRSPRRWQCFPLHRD